MTRCLDALQQQAPHDPQYCTVRDTSLAHRHRVRARVRGREAGRFTAPQSGVSDARRRSADPERCTRDGLQQAGSSARGMFVWYVHAVLAQFDVSTL